MWSRKDGGTITLQQLYHPVGAAEIVTRQTATIAIPHMRAELTADYYITVHSAVAATEP